jgi:hypothetical protein
MPSVELTPVFSPTDCANAKGVSSKAAQADETIHLLM